jgi:hypothetical protein
MKLPPPTERQVQRAIISMMGTAFPSVLVHHSPNGGHLAGNDEARFKQAGALRGDGMKPGFPDLIAIWNRGVAFMEVKRPGYAPSQVKPQQIQIHARLAELGFAPAIVTSPEEAFAFLRERGAPTNIRAWREAA